MTKDDIMNFVRSSGTFYGATNAVWDETSGKYVRGSTNYTNYATFVNIGTSSPPMIGVDAKGNGAPTGSAGVVAGGSASAGATGAYASANHTHGIPFANNMSAPSSLYVQSMDGCYVSTTINISGGKIASGSHVETKDITGSYTGSALGSYGSAPVPARADHSHPMNLPEVYHNSGSLNAGDYLKAAKKSASFGVQGFYCRIDHVHPLPTLGNNASGIGTAEAPIPSSFSNPTIAPSNYGAGYDQTWDRDRDYSNGKGGLLPVCVGFRRVSNIPCLFFRNVRIDRSGQVRNVSAMVYGIQIRV